MDLELMRELEKRTLEKLETNFNSNSNSDTPIPSQIKLLHQVSVQAAIYAIAEYEKLNSEK